MSWFKRNVLALAQIICLVFLTTGAKPHIAPKRALENNEIKFLELKLKKELSDKKISPQRKYTLAILGARDLKQLKHQEKALEFYKLAKDLKVDEDKTEILQALTKKQPERSSVFFYEVNLKKLLKNKSYERALLSMDPEKLNEPGNAHYKIVYDLLNVKIRKLSVKKLYCYDEYQKNPDDYYQYSNLLCDLLVDYLRDGKLGNDHVKVVEEYFFKHDLKERYLLQVAKDLKSSL
ncbi:MAG: hypothetical protein ACXVLQ_03380 [Bacteriovorax sp.]